MHPAVIVLAGQPRQLPHEPALRQSGQHLFDLGAVGERVQPFGAGLQLPRRVGPAQEQDGQQRPFVAGKLELFVEALVVLQRPLPPVGDDHPDQLAMLEFPCAGFQFTVLVRRDGVPTGGLVAGRAQGVE
jgi:hypothetical protein